MDRGIVIKPHHFMDIIKLYGSGIEVFVPDEKMGHDFYKIANRILENPDLPLRLTTGGDDICLPCKMYRETCIDTISHIPQISSKDGYNRLLDARILELFQLTRPAYTALELCRIFYQSHELIFKVWQEEEDQITEKRHNLFLQGAEKYFSNGKQK